MKFKILPYQSVGPLNWSMNRDDVGRELGPPDKVTRNRAGNTVELREQIMLTCIFDKSSGTLVEVGFSKLPGVVFLGDLDLIASRSHDVIRSLLVQDPDAMEGYGSQVFPTLGISLTGYSPEEPEVRAVTVFSQGRWDRLLPSMKAISLQVG